MTIAVMLSRMILTRFVAILLGMSIFIITLDVITYVDEILKLDNGNLAVLLRYAALRLPETLSTFLAISVLLALLLTLSELSYRSELTAIWITGVSPVRMMVMLAPVGIFLGLLNFAVNDRAVPEAAPVLRGWGIGDYSADKLQLGEKDPLWMRAGTDILRAAGANTAATDLEDVVVFRRDKDGLLSEQISARRAQLVNGRWELTDAIVYYQENLPPDRIEKLIYSGNMRPAAVGARSGAPEEMTMSDLGYFIENAGFGIRPAYVYETWWQKRLTLPVTAWLMIVICVPLASRFRRGGAIGTMFAGGVLLGFLFFVFEGVALTMGELGIVVPWMAAWTPVIAFAGIAMVLTLRAESVG